MCPLAVRPNIPTIATRMNGAALGLHLVRDWWRGVGHGLQYAPLRPTEKAARHLLRSVYNSSADGLKDEEPYGLIECHLARANPQWNDLAAGNEALMIFQGPDGYITPNPLKS
jgi:Putative FMN-binding domain